MTRSQSNRLGMYSDIFPILDEALAAGGGTYALATYGDAVHWRQRAYRARKLYANTFGFDMSKYDRLTFPRIKDGECFVTIQLNVSKGVFTPAGEGVPFVEETSDDFTDAAALFAKKIGVAP